MTKLTPLPKSLPSVQPMTKMIDKKHRMQILLLPKRVEMYSIEITDQLEKNPKNPIRLKITNLSSSKVLKLNTKRLNSMKILRNWWLYLIEWKNPTGVTRFSQNFVNLWQILWAKTNLTYISVEMKSEMAYCTRKISFGLLKTYVWISSKKSMTSQP